MSESIYKPRPDCQTPGLEWIYSGVFGDKYDGVFVEIGAHDGASWSNTVFLAELGWRGLYVEPIPELLDRCRGNHKNHPKITVAQRAVGDGSEVQMMRAGKTDYAFTGDPFYANLLGAKDVIGMFSTVTLDELLETYKIPVRFDLLVIDVEGMEPHVLIGWSSLYWLPKMVIIETHELSPDVNLAKNAHFINEYFSTYYNKIYTSEVNTIFIRRY